MGQTPLPPYRPPSRLEVLKRMYVKGSITLEELEERLDWLLRSGRADEPFYPDPGGLPARILVDGELR